MTPAPATTDTFRFSVNRQLTPDRRQRRYRSTDEYMAMMRRLIRAAVRRVAEGDERDLAEMVALMAELDDAVATAVRRLREEQEWTWTSIAEALGVTRQAACKRWGRR